MNTKTLPEIPLDISETLAPLGVRCYAVCYGDVARQCLPIGGYFRDRADAERYYEVIKEAYPGCQLTEQFFQAPGSRSGR